MEKSYERKRKIISVFLILLGIIIIVFMAVSILGKRNNASIQVNNALENTENNVDIINYTTTKDGVIENNSRRVNAEQIVKYLVISNSKIIYENGISKLTADILNRSKNNNNLRIKATFLGNHSEVLAEKEIEVGNINKDETKSIAIELEEDVLNASIVRYEILK